MRCLFYFFFLLGSVFPASAGMYWHRPYTGLHVADDAHVMVPHDTPFVLHWPFHCSGGNDSSSNCTQTTYTMQILDASATPVVDTGLVTSSVPNHLLSMDSLKPGARYSWRVKVAYVVDTDQGAIQSGWSSNHTFFTSLDKFTGKPIWSPVNASKQLPMYSFLRSKLTIPAGGTLVSALAYVTANSPTSLTHSDGGSARGTKVLAAYKMWVGGQLVGMGPGRPRCGPGPCGKGVATPYQPEQVYDGFDITSLLQAQLGVDQTDRAVDIFVSGFGIDQTKQQESAGAPKVLLDIRLGFASNKNNSIVTESHGTTSEEWSAFDSDPIYNPKGNSGCAWYYYPAENYNATNAVGAGDTPVAPFPLSKSVAATGWVAAAEQPAFSAPLTPKPTPPVAITTIPTGSIAVTRIGAGRYFFDLGINIQGGLTVTVALPLPLPSWQRSVTITLAEELDHNSTLAPHAVMYPPRTTTNPRTTWTLATPATLPSATDEKKNSNNSLTVAQTITFHEYSEFRYGELQFGKFAPAPPSDASVEQLPVLPGGEPVFSLSAWVVRQPYNKEHAAQMVSVDAATAATTTTTAAAPGFDHSAPATASAVNDLGRVWELCRYTIEASSLDVYSDSNARQRSADCAADDVTAMFGQYATSEILVLQKYALEQLIAAGAAGIRVDWAVLPILALEQHVLHTGDLDFARSLYDYLVTNHARLDSISSVSGLSEHQHALVDWPHGMQDRFVSSETSSVASAWVYAGAASLSRIARWLNNETESTRVAAIAAHLKAAMNEKQWNGTAFCDGLCENKTTSHTAFHSSFYAVSLGAVSAENTKAAWQYVKRRISPLHGTGTYTNANAGAVQRAERELPVSLLKEAEQQDSTGAGTGISTVREMEIGAASEMDATVRSSWPPPSPYSGDGMPCGVYPSQYAVESLYANTEDHGDAALQVLTSTAKNSWLHMLKQGATMTMEMWTADEKPNLTWSHPWASSPGFIVAWYLFGLRPTSPGFATVQVKPQPGDLASGSYTMPSIRGAITVSFGQQRTGNTITRFEITITLPASVTAVVGVPVPVPTRVSAIETQMASGKSLPRVAAITWNGKKVQGTLQGGHAVVGEVGPGGRHTLIYEDK